MQGFTSIGVAEAVMEGIVNGSDFTDAKLDCCGAVTAMAGRPSATAGSVIPQWFCIKVNT